MSLSVLMLLEGHFPAMGGAERQVETLANALLDEGHHVTVLVPRADRAFAAGAGLQGRIPVWRINYPPIRMLGTLVLMVRLVWLLWRWRRRYDAIHAHIAHNMGAVACVVGRLLDKPVVVKFSGWWEQERGCLRPKGGIGAAAALWMLRQASAIQAISRRIAADLERVGFRPEQVHWLPNGVPMSRFERIERNDTGNTPPTIVFVGRLVPEKGLDTLLHAWAQADRPPGWRLRLVGGGDRGSELAALAARLGIAPSVDFPGASSTVDLELGRADVGVLPSRFEGLSNTLLEYMAAALPVIATRISGSEDLVAPGRNGWLCEVDDVEALSVALSEAMAMPASQRRSMGMFARSDVMAKASVPAVITQLLPLYRGVVA